MADVVVAAVGGWALSVGKWKRKAPNPDLHSRSSPRVSIIVVLRRSGCRSGMPSERMFAGSSTERPGGSPPRSPYLRPGACRVGDCRPAGACVAVLLVTAGDDERSSAAAQLPETAVTSPPPSHHADPALKTYVFRVGPFSIGGYQTFRHNDIVRPPPVAGSIVGMDVRVVDTAGDEIPQPQLMLHHNVFTNGGPDNKRDDGACPQRSVSERFYGTSEELRPLTLPRGYGYPTDPQDHWKMIWMVM